MVFLLSALATLHWIVAGLGVLVWMVGFMFKVIVMRS